jgi:hypothetical protein
MVSIPMMNWSNILEETTLQNLMKETFCIFKRSIRNHNDSNSKKIIILLITYVRNIFVKPLLTNVKLVIGSII